MKHWLSTFLAAVMIFSTLPMLIPTATAVTGEPSPLPAVPDLYDDDNSTETFEEMPEQTLPSSLSNPSASGDSAGGSDSTTPSQPPEVNETVLFEQNFNDPSLASLTDEDLFKAIFGENTSTDTRYITGTGVEASIVNGALKIHAEADGSAFVAKVASHNDISEQGFAVECEYVFHQRALKEGNECDSRFFGFNAKSAVELADKNCLLSYVYNGNYSRVAYRNATSGAWQPVVFSENIDDSGLQETKYKLKTVFCPEDGPSLFVAAWDASLNGGEGGYGEYKLIGFFDEGNRLIFNEAMADSTYGGSNMFSDNVIMKIQNGNHVSIDNLKVTLLEKKSFNVTIDGEPMLVEGTRYLDLTPYYDGPFRFAVVDGNIVYSSIVRLTEETQEIEICAVELDTLDGAALTTGETTSIRWMASLDKSDFDLLEKWLLNGIIETVEYGVLYEDVSTLGTEDVQRAQASNVYELGYEGRYVFHAESLALSTEQYNTRFAGRAYMSITINDDTTILIEGDFDRNLHVRSAAQIAVATILDTQNGLSAEQLEKIEAIVATYVK